MLKGLFSFVTAGLLLHSPSASAKEAVVYTFDEGNASPTLTASGVVATEMEFGEATMVNASEYTHAMFWLLHRQAKGKKHLLPENNDDALASKYFASFSVAPEAGGNLNLAELRFDVGGTMDNITVKGYDASIVATVTIGSDVFTKQALIDGEDCFRVDSNKVELAATGVIPLDDLPRNISGVAVITLYAYYKNLHADDVLPSGTKNAIRIDNLTLKLAQ